MLNEDARDGGTSHPTGRARVEGAGGGVSAEGGVAMSYRHTHRQEGTSGHDCLRAAYWLEALAAYWLGALASVLPTGLWLQ